MRISNLQFVVVFTFFIVSLVCSAISAEPKVVEKKEEKKAAKKQWKSLLEENSLKGWKKTQFGGEADIEIKDGVMTMPMGVPLSGVTYAKEFPKQDYEIELEARRVLGGDFFCCLTFPVKKSFCSFVAGGWGGSVIGLSSIDGEDASTNDTTDYVTFEKKKWYKIRVRVRENDIQVWLDDESMIAISIKDRDVSTRIEVALSEPLGLSSFETTAEIRNIRMRKLTAKEIAQKFKAKPLN